VHPGDFIVIAVGDSMIEAGINDGDRCVIRPQETVENGEIALIAIADGSTIKRFFKENGGYRLMPCNPTHAPLHYGKEMPIRVLGKFIKVISA
jgi:repressor LexA